MPVLLNYCTMFLVIFSNKINSRRLPNLGLLKFKLPDIYESYNMTSHLQFKHIRKVCSSRYSICKSKATSVCAMRVLDEHTQYKDFENSCYLFLSNMCEYPGREFHILWSGNCEDYRRYRRQEDLQITGSLEDLGYTETTATESITEMMRRQNNANKSQANNTSKPEANDASKLADKVKPTAKDASTPVDKGTTEKSTAKVTEKSATKDGSNPENKDIKKAAANNSNKYIKDENKTTAKDIRKLAAKDEKQTPAKQNKATIARRSATHAKTTKKTTTTKVTFSTLYDIDTAFDEHICPMSCPNTYSPICLLVNRGFGEYFKFLTFINHCLGDKYYCKNWQEFEPPPGETEMVNSSPLSWSFCGASRYISFARFSEVASSMGHYGWLKGDYKATHIMEPNERVPGFGK